MGQRASSPRDLVESMGWSAPTTLLALALLLLVALAGGTAAEERPWGSLEMADVPLGTPVEVVGDGATFRVHAHWGGFLADDPALFIIEPLPEGWTYSVEGGSPTGSGVLLNEDTYAEGLMEVTVRVSEDTPPGTYYIEPRIDHSTEARTLASLPVYVDVPAYHMVPVMTGPPSYPVLPGARVSFRMAVETGVPVDRLARLDLTLAPRGWEAHTPWRSVLLTDGASEPVTFSLTVAGDALPGEYAVMFAARSPDPRVVAYVGVETLTVERVMALAPGDGDVQLATPAGQVTTGQVTIVNEGNVPATVLGVAPSSYLDLPPGWELVARDLPVTVPPFSSAVLEVGVDLPADPLRVPSGAHHVPLRIMTQGGAMDLGVDLVALVPEVRALHLATAGDLEPQDPEGYEMGLTLLVRDLGNVDRDRAVWLTYDRGDLPSYLDLSRAALMMSSGDVETVDINVRVDPRTRPGSYPLVLRVEDGSGAAAELEVTVEVARPQLQLVGDLEVEATQDEGHYAGGEASMYVVTGTVENMGERDLDFAKVEVYDTSSGEPASLGYVPIHDLPAGATRTFRFTLDRARPGDNAVMAHPSVPGTDGDPFEDSLESRFEAEVVTPAPEGPLVLFTLAIAVGSLAGLVTVIATEAGRFALMATVVIPLYTRLKPEQVTDHFVRGQILGYVKANPGETYTHIRRALKLTNGTFVYHARILETQGHIRSVKDGANRRFYPADMRIPAEVRDVKLNQVQRMIYTIVMEYPGISQAKIAKIVKLAPSTVNYHVNIMSKVGVIERKRSGRLSLIFATDDTD